MYRYIAIEGPIGVGKTELATLLANKLGAKLLLESVTENHFLEKFYHDRKRYAFTAQVFFLFSRYNQLQDLVQRELFQSIAVSDYFFAKDHIFATLNLSEEELKLYQQIYSLLVKRVPKPDLVVYLQANVDVLMEHIEKRKREFERAITKEYVASVAEAFNRYFFFYNETPLLIVNTDEIDFVNNPEERDLLMNMILKPHRGTTHFVPGK